MPGLSPRQTITRLEDQGIASYLNVWGPSEHVRTWSGWSSELLLKSVCIIKTYTGPDGGRKVVVALGLGSSPMCFPASDLFWWSQLSGVRVPVTKTGLVSFHNQPDNRRQ